MIDALRLFDRTRLREIVGRFPGLRIAVLGDFFLDRYLELAPALAEISLETGKTAHQVIALRHAPGAAGNVVANLAALGAGRLTAIGFRGDDGEGWELERDLRMLGVEEPGLAVEKDRHTPTYLKPRDATRPGLEGEHDRYDTKNRSPTPSGIEDRVIEAMEATLPCVDALVVLDQVEEEGFGVLTPRVREALLACLPRHPRLVAWADSRRRIGSFRGLNLKMNQFELVGLHDPAPGASVAEKSIIAGIASLESRANGSVFVTAGERGVWLGGEEPLMIPGIRIDGPVDTTGAGDSFSAAAVLALAAGATSHEAALLGCLAASVTVRQLGMTGSARPEDLETALGIWMEQNT